MKLSLCLIVKNEEKTIPTLLDSVKGVFDEIVVVDTGSTDNTLDIIQDRNDSKVVVVDNFEWIDDFSAARQKSFDLATGDWIVWADADDIIQNAAELRNLAEKCDKDGVNAVVFPYHYVVDEYGNTTVLQMRERLIKNNGMYKWVGRLHETLIPQNKMALALSLTSVQWIHRTTTERIQASKERNVRILESALEEELKAQNVDPRTVYNLGNAYFTVENYTGAVGCYLQYIPLSGWLQERYLARHRASLAFLYQKDYPRALEMAFTALEEEPSYPDAYIDIGKIYFEKKEFEKALHWFHEAEKRNVPEKLPVYNPMDYTANLSWLIGHCYVQMSQFKQALPYFQDFKKFYPKNEQIENILQIINEGVEEAELVRAVTEVGRKLKSLEFWKLVPQNLLEYPEVLHEKNKLVVRTETTGKDMAIYCGKCVVQWDPTSEKEGGIGGSEEAVINVTRRLAKMGWNITVYGLPKVPGVYDGVRYENFTEFNPNDAWDVFVSWRMPSVFNAEINAKKKYCWLHDCTPQDAFGPEILKNLDKIIVLSKYHRSLYPQIPEEKFFYSGNGIDPDQFTGPVEKIKNRCINTSAPDRGLEVLLHMWPKILEKVPDATLRWHYGWEVFDKLHAENQEMQDYKTRIKLLFDQPGVVEGGRLDHFAIAEEYKKAEYWLYPTEFTETFCITGAKAQAAGALPVTTNVAALAETVQYGKIFDAKDMYSNQELQDEYVNTVVKYMQEPEKTAPQREGMKEWACGHFDWQNIAEQWNNELT